MKCVIFPYTLILLSPLYEVCPLFIYHTHFTVSSLWNEDITLILLSPLYEVCHLSISHSFYCLLFMKCVLFSYITLILLSPLYEVCPLFIHHTHFTVSSLWSVSSFHTSHSFYCLLFMKWVYHTHFTVSSLWSVSSFHITLILLSPLYDVRYLAVQGAGWWWWWWWWGWTEDSPALAGGTRLCFHPGHNLVLPSWHHSIVFGQLQVHAHMTLVTRTHDACYTHTWRLLHAHMTLVTCTHDACYMHTWRLLHAHVMLVTHTHTHEVCYTHGTCYTHTWRLLHIRRLWHTHTWHLLHAHMMLVTAHDTCYMHTWHLTLSMAVNTHMWHPAQTWTHTWQTTNDIQCVYVCVCVCVRMCVCVCTYVCVCVCVCR